jgi:hypothetical protein
MGVAEFLRNIETLLTRSESGRAKLKATLERVQVISEMRKKMAKG